MYIRQAGHSEGGSNQFLVSFRSGNAFLLQANQNWKTADAWRFPFKDIEFDQSHCHSIRAAREFFVRRVPRPRQKISDFTISELFCSTTGWTLLCKIPIHHIQKRSKIDQKISCLWIWLMSNKRKHQWWNNRQPWRWSGDSSSWEETFCVMTPPSMNHGRKMTSLCSSWRGVWNKPGRVGKAK